MKNKRNHLVTAREAVAACCAFATSVLIAQEESQTTLPTMEVVANALDLPLLYQTRSSSAALFSETPLIETPFSVSIYNEELMEDQRAFNLTDILKNDPSIALQMPGGFYNSQNFGLRGFQVDNFNGYRVDGLPMIQTVSPYLDDKSRVEVLKGPAALRFRFMPPGGAINLVRKRPMPEFSTSLHADVDTFGAFYNQLDVSDTVADGTFGYRLVLANEEFDSFYDNADGRRTMGSLFTEWKPMEALSVWSSFGVQKSERNGYYGPMVTANGEILDTGRKTNIMQDWAHNDQDILEAAVGVDFDINEDWKMRTSFNYQDTRRESALSYPYSVQDNGDYTEGALLTNGPFEWDSWGAHLHLEGSFETGALKHDLVVGSQYRTYDTYGERSFPDVGPNNAYDPVGYPEPAPGVIRAIDFEYSETAFFVTDTIEFSEQWSALLGARYGRYENTYPDDPASDDDVNAWSPTAALMYEPAKDIHTYVSYTKGLQDGGFADRTAANAFEPLGVQKSEQWEVGVKTEMFGGRLAGELALFQIEQDLALVDSSGVDAFSGQQRHRGVELAVRGKITDELQAGISAMFLDAEQVDTGDDATSGKRPQYVPAYQVNVWSVLEIPQVPGLALTANVRFVDKQYLDQAEQFAIDSYSVVDIGARYRFQAADADWTVRLNIENTLDERYYESGEFYSGDAGYLAYGAPVSANLSLQIDF